MPLRKSYFTSSREKNDSAFHQPLNDQNGIVRRLPLAFSYLFKQNQIDGLGWVWHHFTMPSLDITNIAWEQLPVLWVCTSIERNVDNFGCLG